MKTGIHPQLHDTKVHCNGCDTSFVLSSTVPTITVEICSNCHPFYTGKQKLIDTAGRVDKFKARQAAANRHAEASAKTKNAKDTKLAEIQDELQNETIESSPTDLTEA